MPQDELLLAILGVAILLNVLLVAATWPRSQSRRPPRARAAEAPQGAPGRVPDSPSLPADRQDERRDDWRVAAAVEAFVAGISPDAAGSARIPTPAEVLARANTQQQPASHDFPEAHGRGPARLAELTDAVAWKRIVAEESARVARFGRPSTVVTASLPHLDHVARSWGSEAADRIVAETARVLASEGRAVDHIARLGDARFGILLPETGELGASTYAGRVRAIADAWLMSAGLSVRLELDWANVATSPDVDLPPPAALPPNSKGVRG